MKHLFIFLIALLLEPFALQAQVKIGDNLANINVNSLLELESTTKALLLPRLNQGQIDAMQNVPAGMLVYNSTTNLLNIRTNSSWVTLSMAANAASATNPWSVSGSTTYTNAGQIGIGTNQPSSQLSNNSGNTAGSDGQGGNPGSISWAASQGGYVGQIYNGATGAFANGLVVKVNSTSATALDVSQGPQSGATAPLLTVKSSGKVGVNNSNPSEALEVNGNIKYSGNLQMGFQFPFYDLVIPPRSIGSITLPCPAGTKLISGGGGMRDSSTNAEDFQILYNGFLKNDLNNWLLICRNMSNTTDISIRLYLTCAKVQ